MKFYFIIFNLKEVPEKFRRCVEALSLYPADPLTSSYDVALDPVSKCKGNLASLFLGLFKGGLFEKEYQDISTVIKLR